MRTTHWGTGPCWINILRIAITGVSGFVGSQIVSRLRELGVDLVLLGRDPRRLREIYPEQTVFGYSEMREAFVGADAVLHLAVQNDAPNIPAATYRAVNVEFLKEVVVATLEAGVPRMIYPSSTHVGARSSHYGISKYEAETFLETVKDDFILTVLRLPAIYGERFSGNLRWSLGKVPGFLKGSAFKALAALKPTVHVDNVTRAVIDAARATDSRTVFVSDKQIGNNVYHGTKRTIDVVFALTVLVLLWWLLAAIWALVRVTSAGPGVFSHERVGRHGKPFTCYKFRTMRIGTGIVASHDASAANITSIGGFLRRTKLDELPQIFNILRNEMSLVGPRPCLPTQTEVIRAREKLGVLEIKGGITGYAQINDIDMVDPARVAEADAYYFAGRTITLDLMIMLKTAMGAGRGDRVRAA